MKSLVPVILAIFIISIGFSGISYNNEKSLNLMYDGITLYVGGSGPSNYTKIQDAIDNASDGDTVFVFSGVYFENLIVNRSINLIGEDKNNTFIWSVLSNNGCTITIVVDSVLVKDLSIFNSSSSRPGINMINSDNSIISDCNLYLNYAGMWISNSNNITITDCYITDKGISFHNTHNSKILKCSIKLTKGDGIYLHESTYNLISNCNFYDNSNGVYLDFSSSNNTIRTCRISCSRSSGVRIAKSFYNLVSECNISSCYLQGIFISGNSFMNVINFNNLINNDIVGIRISYSDKNIILGNNINNHEFVGPQSVIGIELLNSINNTIEKNEISNNIEKGIILTDSDNNSIIRNNFRENEINAFFKDSHNNKWSHNFWNRIRFLPKSIRGLRSIQLKENIEINVPSLNFDLRPALRPFNIGV